MGRVYCVVYKYGQGVQSDTTPWEIQAGSTRPFRLLAVDISGTTATTGATEDVPLPPWPMILQIFKNASPEGTGQEETPRPMHAGDSAFTGTAKRSLGAPGTETGKIVTIPWQYDSGIHWRPLRGFEPVIQPTECVTVWLTDLGYGNLVAWKVYSSVVFEEL